MNEFGQRNKIVAGLVFFFTTIIYLSTLAPTVAFWDCGEFITTAYTLGIPHPPGAPFYTLLGRIFSMLPFGEIAFRVNLLSAAAGIVTVVFIYLCTVRLLCTWLDRENTVHQIAILVGGVVASLSTAFSFSFWNNAIEAEVYGLSMCITMLAVWVALRWDDAHKDHNSDRLLLFIAYLFGLGAGVHLQCLLTIPGILILLFTDLMEDRPLKHQVLVVVGLTLYPFLSIVFPIGVAALLTGAVVIGLLILRPEWRTPQFWLLGVIIGALGFSTYFALFIRSGLNPMIDMNDPETWENFKAFMGRQQYGIHLVFPRRAEPWAFQFNIFIKYFLQQFPFFDGISAYFRRAVDVYMGRYEIIHFSLITLALGIGGAVYHLRKDWKRFASLFAMFALMGVGLVLYLNMPDPEPREREYIFVGAYTFFGIWMGIGAAGLIAEVKNKSLAVLVAALMLLVPSGILVKNYHVHDRTGDFVPYDYAYNIMATCDENAILFTNGDNDTYPLWFLQGVEGVRNDIQIVNLSLIKTSWYIKQLKRLGVEVGLEDDEIEGLLGAYPWDYDRGIEVAGLKLEAGDLPIMEYPTGRGRETVSVLEPHTLMIWRIVKYNWEKRPIYFAVTVPDINMAGLKPYLSMEGMGYKLVKSRGYEQFEEEKIKRNLLEVYRYTGVADSTVHKDPVARRLLGNYLILFDGLVRAYIRQGMHREAYEVLMEVEKRVPPYALDFPETWQLVGAHYRDIALYFYESGDVTRAVSALENLLRLGPPIENPEDIHAIIEQWKRGATPRDVDSVG
ncbi:MAG: DUF2723 domain-containing protein, partial [Gemmatimonadota bacterium]|nr:DUF2723 domain-containing protein [Gemmatimonadota bacterium]